PRPKRSLVSRAHNGTSAILLVKLEPAGILPPRRRVRAKSRVVRQALEEETVDADRACRLAHALVQGAARAAADTARGGSDEAEIAEVQIRGMQHQSEAAHPAPRILGDEEEEAEPVFERIAQLFGKSLHLFIRDCRETFAQDRLHQPYGIAVRWSAVVEDLSDPEHHPVAELPARGSRMPASTTIRPTTSTRSIPAPSAAAAKPASGLRQGFAFTSRTKGVPLSSTRKSTRAYPRRPNRCQHRSAIWPSLPASSAASAPNSRLGVFP